MKCDKKLIMAYYDNELEPEEITQVKKHLSECPECVEYLNSLKELKEVVEMKKPVEPTAEEWHVYWVGIYNRIERMGAWLLISISLTVLIGAGLYSFVMSFMEDTNVPVFIKLTVFTLLFGFVILFISILREKLYLNKRDKYEKESIL